MNLLLANLANALFVLGLLVLAIEILVLEMSNLPLLVVGVSALLTSIAMMLDWLQADWQNTLFGMALFAVASLLVLWSPFKTYQQRMLDSSELEGHRFVLPGDIGPSQSVGYRYCGFLWQVSSRYQICAGTEVEVIQSENGLFEVKAVVDAEAA